MNVLFVNPHYPYEPHTLLLHPPLCYAYMASVLKAAGHDVQHADLPFHGNSARSLLPFLENARPDLVGVTCVAQSYCQALEIARLVKEWNPRIPVVLGGPHVTFIPREALERHGAIDHVLLFDAEHSMRDLASALEVGAGPSDLAKIPGLAFRHADGVAVTPPSPPVRDLDVYPPPDRSIFEMKRYLDYDYETVVMTARGCPSRCTFCSTTQIGRRYRWHSASRVCDEIEEVLDMGFSSVFFGDDTFSGNGARTLEFCKEVKQRGLCFDWTSNMRALDAKPEVLDAMREAGAYRVFMGFESIQASTLRLVKKGTTPERLHRTGNVVRAHGLELHAAFIIGAPGDTHESLEATLDFIRLLDPTVATFNVMEPRPGTDVFHDPTKYGLHIPDPFWYETTDWVHGPVCHTATLTHREIKQWIERCYDEFCSPSFRDGDALQRIEEEAALLAGSSPAIGEPCATDTSRTI